MTSDAALVRYRTAMRRSRAIYYAVLAALLVLVGVGVGVAWATGEAAHASLHTIRSAPTPLGIGTPSPTQQEAWHSSDHIALGVPQWNGTVVTFSRHTVGGRDARTGKATWAYTRTDRTVCTAAQLSGTTIAVYENDGSCDEVGAFDSGTGARRWTRTLDMDGMPVEGQPTYQVTPFTLLVATPSVIYAIDPVSGYNRWTYERYGCRLGGVALGSAGALISQTCSAKVQCANVKFCGRGPQLLLRDGSAGRGDDSKPNADQIKWMDLGNDSVPASADQMVTAQQPRTNAMQLFDATSGKVTQSLPLQPVAGSTGELTSVASSTGELIWSAGRTYALRSAASGFDWTAATLSPPTVASTSGDVTPELSGARITVPTSSGIALLNGTDGRVSSRFAVPAPAAGSVVYSLGTGFLVTGPDGMTAYR